MLDRAILTLPARGGGQRGSRVGVSPSVPRCRPNRALSACKAAGDCVESPARGCTSILGNTMRIALTTALMLLATMALADEPSAPETKTETEATATQAPTDNAGGPARADRDHGQGRDERRRNAFKPPAGYRPKRVDGEQVWCQKTVVLGSKFPKEDCRTEAQLRDMIRSRQSMREELDQSTPVQRRRLQPSTDVTRGASRRGGIAARFRRQ